jgi:hypothetical protein
MRYELNDYEWTAIKPMLPNKPRGVRRVNDRRALNGIFWVLRSRAPRLWMHKIATHATKVLTRSVDRIMVRGPATILAGQARFHHGARVGQEGRKEG